MMKVDLHPSTCRLAVLHSHVFRELNCSISSLLVVSTTHRTMLQVVHLLLEISRSSTSKHWRSGW